jgi:serine protease AprX
MKVSVRNPSSRFLLAACVLFALPALVSAGERRSKLDKALRGLLGKAPASQRVIIQARPGSRAALKQALLAHGDVVRAEHPSLEALTVDLHGEDLAALEADPSVMAVSIDAEVTSFGKGRRKSSRPAVDILRYTLGLTSTSPTGRGVNVAIVDSGIEPTNDLRLSIAGFWDFTRGGVSTKPQDEYGHGTHVAGIIASSGGDSKKEFEGVAPGVTLYGFKVLNQNGRGRVSDVVKALEFIVANHRAGSFRTHIINLSLGHPIYEPASTDPLVKAVENAVRAGIVVVTAAGNVGSDPDGDIGYAGITSPGNAPSAITVGASDTRGTQKPSDDRVAYFSSRGPAWFDGYAKPDIVAPGVMLASNAARFAELYDAYPQLKMSSKSGNGNFARLSGTSMAAAVTTGVVALMFETSADRQRNSHHLLPPNAVKAVLQYTAIPLRDAEGAKYDSLTQGTGAINALGAMEAAEVIDPSVSTRQPWLRYRPRPVTVLGGESVEWAQTMTWRDRLVVDSDALAYNSVQWARNIVWGTRERNIVWGTAADLENIVWGTAIGWAADIVFDNRIVGLMDGENIVWGTLAGLDQENIVWGTFDGENIVWGTVDGENVVWGTFDGENIVWGTLFDELENIVWGTLKGENIVWGTDAWELRDNEGSNPESGGRK